MFRTKFRIEGMSLAAEFLKIANLGLHTHKVLYTIGNDRIGFYYYYFSTTSLRERLYLLYRLKHHHQEFVPGI